VQLDEDLYAAWLLQPDWTGAVNAVLDQELTVAAQLGGLGLATDALRVLQELSTERDLEPGGTPGARLAALLSGQAALPAMPAEVPPPLRDPDDSR
jgi:hypothetical protein